MRTNKIDERHEARIEDYKAQLAYWVKQITKAADNDCRSVTLEIDDLTLVYNPQPKETLLTTAKAIELMHSTAPLDRKLRYKIASVLNGDTSVYYVDPSRSSAYSSLPKWRVR